MSNIKVPDWISTQSYQLNDGKLVSYIFNHKLNEFIELEGFSSILWSQLAKNVSQKDISEFARINHLEDELEEFLNDLISAGLLITDTGDFIRRNKNESVNSFEHTDAFFMEIIGTIAANGFLSKLFLEMTYNCNLKCIHCFNEKNCENQIKFEDVRKSIDEAAELGTILITLSGGECTLNKDFIKIIEYIRKKKIAFEFFTNGQKLYDDNELFEKVISLYPLEVVLSLYSMNPEIHDKITGITNSHKKTLYVIKKLRENNINVRINCFLTKYNAYEYKEVEKFAKENNTGLILDYKLIDNPTKSNSDVRITKNQLLNILVDKESVLDIKNLKTKDTIDDFMNLGVCTAGYKSLLVNPNLDIYVCPVLKIPLGNIKSVSLKDIWTYKGTGINLKKIKSVKNKDLKQCFQEEYCKYCAYCPGVAHTAGFYLQPYKLFCENAKIQMEAAERR